MKTPATRRQTTKRLHTAKLLTTRLRQLETEYDQIYMHVTLFEEHPLKIAVLHTQLKDLRDRHQSIHRELMAL